MHAGGDGLVRRRGRALVLIWVEMGSLWIWIWVGSVRALGRLWGRADVFVGGVALGAGRSIHPRRDETKKT
ncbi:hypothetical protein B0H13DRAFT_2036472 [Mycena leptocephala]|nr:hypothetical protein B0H13DRAFT_2036472 [Mycena leptocephala]